VIGSTIQNYRILRELGTGAMGAVYEAVDTFVERPVAIKMLRAEIARQPDLIERFRSEAVTLARLSHPNIALLYNFFREGDDYYMVMEFVPGQPLENIIRHGGNLEPAYAVRIMGQTLEGLAHAHNMGVLHRDIKPANILVTQDGRVKVTDFGIARVLGSSRMTRHGRIIGTLEYIAPERIRGDEADPRSDLYSAGVVLYEMLTQRLPFTGSTDYDLIKAHLEQEPPALSAVLGSAIPGEWDEIVRRAMAKSAGERFQTAQEFHDALPGVAMAAAAGTGVNVAVLKPTRLAEIPPQAAAIPQPPPAPSGMAVRQKKPLALWIGAAAAGLVLLIAGLVVASRVSSWRAAQQEAKPTPAVVVTPPIQPPVQAEQDQSWRNNPPAATIPVSTSGPKEPPARKDSSNSKRAATQEEKRKAALRALDGGDANSGDIKPKKDSKRSDALGALER
jgi:serine/threonine-protein kinase